jgi:hypothetical protein
VQYSLECVLLVSNAISQEYSALIKTCKEKGFLTVSCLNCEMSPVYSVKEPDNSARVIIHEKALVKKEEMNVPIQIFLQVFFSLVWQRT